MNSQTDSGGGKGKDFFGAAKIANIRSVQFNPNIWADLDAPKAVHEIFDIAVAHANEADRWYSSRKGNKACASRLLRFIAIVGGTLGAFAPIVSAMVPSADSLFQLQVTQAGYLAVGIAAGALAFDRFFGLSSGWLRYMTAMTTIERLRLEFVSDWAKMRRQSISPQAADVSIALERVTVFRMALLKVVEDETNAWAGEFRSTMDELSKFIQETRTKAEATLQEIEKQRAEPQTGGLNLTIAGIWDGEAEILVDRVLNKKSTHSAVGLSDLRLGLRELEVRATKDSKSKKASKIIAIEAGKTTEATIDLG